jgi:dTDP-4-dehydrorhamnose reductase
MRWLITGASGMLGTDLRGELNRSGEEVLTVSLPEFDITDRDAVLALMAHARPDVVVNCAAFTQVDDCETREEEATLVNGAAPGFFAEGANATGSLLVQISTDFVFDGSARRPYEVDDEPAPVSAYGRSKLRGEIEAAKGERHVILRTSWLFGERGWNFVEAMRRQIDGERSELRVVDDQVGRPTWTPHLASAIVRLAHAALRDETVRGIFHYGDADPCSWFDFARAIVEELDRRSLLPNPVAVVPITSAEIARPARRPAWSVLSTERYERVTGSRVEQWREGLADYLGGAGK